MYILYFLFFLFFKDGGFTTGLKHNLVYLAKKNAKKLNVFYTKL